MNSNREKPPAIAFIMLLFFIVVAMFALFYYPTQKIKNNSSNSIKSDKNVTAERFIELMNSGKNMLVQGSSGAEKAAESFRQASILHPGDLDARLNLANAYLLLNQTEEVLKQSSEALKLNQNAAAAHYLTGCALVRTGQFEKAVQSLQVAKQIDPTVNAVSYQLGRSYQGLGQWESASLQFEEVIQFDPQHPSAFYNLSQTYIRLERQKEAEQMLERHQSVISAQPLSADPSTTEKCIYTEPIAPFQLEQPDANGIKVYFTDATEAFLGDKASTYLGPAGVVDVGHDDQLDLLVREKGKGYTMLIKRAGVFQAHGFPLPLLPEATYFQCLIGDLQHQGSMRGGQQEDAILLTDKGTQVFQISPNGMLSDSSLFTQLAPLQALKGRLTDFDITGKLDLLSINTTNRSLLYHRNQGTFSFTHETRHSSFPADIEGVSDLVVADWDGDDLPDLFIARETDTAQLYLKQRGGSMTQAAISDDWPKAKTLAVADLNNDLRTDVAFLTSDGLQIRLQGDTKAQNIDIGSTTADSVQCIDYDNDGWLDILVYGKGIFRAWRNEGLSGFVESTRTLGLEQLKLDNIQSLSRGDFDGDCDSDLLLTLEDQTLRILRNEGGNRNTMMKIRMEGSRSNPSGIGVKVEVTTGGLRLARTLHELPLEIGLGKRKKVDSIDPHWTDTITQVDYEIEDCSSLVLFELEMPTGSCPYLYAWNGEKYRFVTDLLGAAPLGLPAKEGVYIPADTEEIVWVGNESIFPPKNGNHILQVTEELREVLYLDEAKMIIVDHPTGTEVHSTSKLVARPPFPQHGIQTLGHAKSLRSAMRSDGMDCTEALQEIDKHMASPVNLRAPQLRGLAEPFALELDFGHVDGTKPWALVMTGWLHFGGGMSNIGASHDPQLPFPFPTLERLTSNGQWKSMPIEIGAPAGKTKTIVTDLNGQLPTGPLRLRLTMSFEIHWDRIQLMQTMTNAYTQVHTIAPAQTDLHWRGFSRYLDQAWTQPLTPDYEDIDFAPNWLITPSGWCTRYGEVDPLIASRDNQLVLMNGGDELTLKFATNRIPAKENGQERDFFFFSSGWDKDADFHVAQGWTVAPLPWHGMDSQAYGNEQRPKHLSDDWIQKYNKRWVGSMTLRQQRSSK
ncbi:MAG: FG-GAP-like repeat-containing protein [Verrucomicrobiota bacterium]|nr:FG-GAP-like repeat-containing protein [Verrucomicrobiota bacterium]MDG1890511.1 FG-GAP-like repeat-containing protein [Verrucomicrobiota bacterium]